MLIIMKIELFNPDTSGDHRPFAFKISICSTDDCPFFQWKKECCVFCCIILAFEVELPLILLFRYAG